MVDIQYDAGTHRLRLVGACARRDVERVREAIDTFGRMSRATLTVDLSPATMSDAATEQALTTAFQGMGQDVVVVGAGDGKDLDVLDDRAEVAPSRTDLPPQR